MRCSICGLPIIPEPVGGWDQGNNAQPINDGRCCNECNDIVIRRRINDAILARVDEKQRKANG